MNVRLQSLLDSRHIEAREADDEEIVGMWTKAIRSYRSALTPGLEGDPSLAIRRHPVRSVVDPIQWRKVSEEDVTDGQVTRTALAVMIPARAILR